MLNFEYMRMSCLNDFLHVWMVFLHTLWCAIINRQTRINKCRAMAPNLGWFQWKAHKYAFQLIMGFHDGKHATMNYVDYKQHATKYIGFLLILARSHSRWPTHHPRSTLSLRSWGPKPRTARNPTATALGSLNMYLKLYATYFTLSIALLCVPYPSRWR